ncbi:hypothetical protein Gotur_018842 [Gossypium turneri]
MYSNPRSMLFEIATFLGLFSGQLCRPMLGGQLQIEVGVNLT